jgi:hypothetical protein
VLPTITEIAVMFRSLLAAENQGSELGGASSGRSRWSKNGGWWLLR